MSLLSVIMNSVWAHSWLHDITMPSRGKRGEPGVFLHPTCSDLTSNPLLPCSRWILRRHHIFDIWHGSAKLLLLSACWKNKPQKHSFTLVFRTNFALFTHFFVWYDVFSKLPNHYKYGRSNLWLALCWPSSPFGSMMPTSPWWVIRLHPLRLQHRCSDFQPLRTHLNRRRDLLRRMRHHLLQGFYRDGRKYIQNNPSLEFPLLSGKCKTFDLLRTHRTCFQMMYLKVQSALMVFRKCHFCVGVLWNLCVSVCLVKG